MHAVLPDWLERWLGIDPSGPGQVTVWDLETTWAWAPLATLALIAFAACWVLYFYARESAPLGRKIVLFALRMASIGLVLVMIAELMLSLRRTGLPSVIVVVDDSDSMSIADRYDEKTRKFLEKLTRRAGLTNVTRLNVAKSLLLPKGGRLLRELDAQYKLRLYFVSDSLRLETGSAVELENRLRKLEPQGRSSQLGRGLRQILDQLRGAPPAAIVFFTDGVTTEGETLRQAARAARDKNVPLFTIATGSPEPPRDVDLSELLADDVVYVEDVITFDAKLRAHGVAGRQVELVLREKGKPKVLARTTLTISGDGSQTGRLAYHPTDVGQFTFELEARPLADEIDKSNNRQERSINVRKDKIRVLLVQAYPSYEYRYLSNMLARDKSIELKTLLEESDLEHSQSDPSALSTFPVSREELADEDVLILGDVNPSLLGTTALDNIRALVEKKGIGIAIIAGPRYTPLSFAGTPLEALLPCELSATTLPPPNAAVEGFSLRLTELGTASPHMQLSGDQAENQRAWSQLPPLYWLLEMRRMKPGARVLAEQAGGMQNGGGPLPVIAMQYFGAGKVLFHATDETWRWRFRTGDAVLARYWGQAIRYLSRSKLLEGDRSVELRALRREVPRGEAVQFRARFVDERRAPTADDAVQLVVEREGFANERVTLRRDSASRGVFEGSLVADREGRYRARLVMPAIEGSAPTVDFQVLAPPGERERTAVDLDELKSAARATRGRQYDALSADELLDDLPPGRQVPIEPLPPHALWNRWWMVLALVGMLSTEWILRKRWSMV